MRVSCTSGAGTSTNSKGRKVMTRFLGRIGLLAVVALLPLTAWAQTAQVGQVTGTVTDTSGGALPGATVTLSSEERGVSRNTVTDASGKFLFAIVALGK